MQLKKIALVFLVVIMMFSLAAIGIAAEGAGSEFSLSTKVESENALSKDPLAVKPGDIIEFVIGVDSNPGAIKSIEVRVSFDTEALEFQGVLTEDIGDIFEKNDDATLSLITSKDNANNSGIIQAWLMSKGESYVTSGKTGMFVTLKFKVSETFDGEIDNLDVTYASYALYGASFVQIDMPETPSIKAHKYSDPTDEVGTCVTSANKVYTCAHEGCDEVLKVPTGVLGGHNCLDEKFVSAKAATCVATGNVAHYVCANEGCGKYIAEDKTTVLDSVEVAIDSNAHKCENLVPAVAATCAAKGNVAYYVCGNAGCGKNIAEDKKTVLASVETAIDSNAHKCDTLIPAVAPDCVTDGSVAYYVCGNAGCGKNIAEDKKTVLSTIVDPKVGHKCDTLIPAVAPGCETEGNVAYYVCGYESCGKYIAEDKTTILDGIVLPANGHNYGELVAKVPATTEKEGSVAHYLCSVCGKYFNEGKTEIASIVIPKLPKMISVPEESVWTKGGDSSLTFVSNAKFDDFECVKINNILLGEGGYKLEKTEDGSTKITLEPAYLEQLDAADYTISIHSANGSCDADFTIENSSAALAIIIVVIAVVVIVAGAVAAIVVLKKKNII